MELSITRTREIGKLVLQEDKKRWEGMLVQPRQFWNKARMGQRSTKPASTRNVHTHTESLSSGRQTPHVDHLARPVVQLAALREPVSRHEFILPGFILHSGQRALQGPGLALKRPWLLAASR
ncbi:hypothetical protein MRX96_038463 [Rhipicephalus microplus]